MHPPTETELHKLMVAAGKELGIADEKVAEMYKKVAAQHRAPESVVPDAAPQVRIEHSVHVKGTGDDVLAPELAKSYLSKMI